MEADFFSTISKKPEFDQLISDLNYIRSHKVIPRPFKENLTEYNILVKKIEERFKKYFDVKIKTGFHRIVLLFFLDDKPILVLKYPLIKGFENTSISESNYLKIAKKLNLRHRFPPFFKIINKKVLLTSYAKPVNENFFRGKYDEIYKVAKLLNISDLNHQNIGLYNGNWIFIDWGYELTIGFLKKARFPLRIPSDLEEKFKK